MLNGLSLCCMDAERLEDAREYCERLLALTGREDNQTLVKTRLETVIAMLDSKPSAKSVAAASGGKGPG